MACLVLIEEPIVAMIVRALLWTLLVIAPGGVLLLPLLVGDAMAQRKKRGSLDSMPDVALPGVEAVPALEAAPLSVR